ncbi:MAG TPA: YIP1 family protein [Longimicrobiales bacterium]
MMGAALLRPAVYEEVEADRDATGQAALVVGIVAVAAAIGGTSAGGPGFFTGLIAAYLGWLIWSGITYIVGDKLLGGTATWGELLRTVGFAQSPGVLYILGFIPFLGGIVAFIVWIWLIIAVVIAIRQALDFGTGKAILTAVIGFIGYLILVAIVGWLIGVRPTMA